MFQESFCKEIFQFSPNSILNFAPEDGNEFCIGFYWLNWGIKNDF